MNNKSVTLERDGKRQVVVLRQMPGHDKPAILGKQFSFLGKRWMVVEVREAK